MIRLALLAIPVAFLLGSESALAGSYQLDPTTRLEVTKDAEEESTAFSLEGDAAVSATVSIKRQGKIVSSFTLKANPPDDFVLNSLDTYMWSCKRTGAHSWTATVTSIDPQPHTASGKFVVPKCREKPIRVVRSTVGKWINDELKKDPNYVVDKRCVTKGRRKGSTAHTWSCGVIWLSDFTGSCAARYLIRAYDNIRFGVSNGKFFTYERVTKIYCYDSIVSF